MSADADADVAALVAKHGTTKVGRLREYYGMTFARECGAAITLEAAIPRLGADHLATLLADFSTGALDRRLAWSAGPTLAG